MITRTCKMQKLAVCLPNMSIDCYYLHRDLPAWCMEMDNKNIFLLGVPSEDGLSAKWQIALWQLPKDAHPMKQGEKTYGAMHWDDEKQTWNEYANIRMPPTKVSRQWRIIAQTSHAMPCLRLNWFATGWEIFGFDTDEEIQWEKCDSQPMTTAQMKKVQGGQKITEPGLKLSNPSNCSALVAELVTFRKEKLKGEKQAVTQKKEAAKREAKEKSEKAKEKKKTKKKQAKEESEKAKEEGETAKKERKKPEGENKKANEEKTKKGKGRAGKGKHNS